ncbi:MAG: hypothetical protein WA118_06725 [Carboxydocellales bacterium]
MKFSVAKTKKGQTFGCVRPNFFDAEPGHGMFFAKDEMNDLLLLIYEGEDLAYRFCGLACSSHDSSYVELPNLINADTIPSSLSILDVDSMVLTELIYYLFTQLKVLGEEVVPDDLINGVKGIFGNQKCFIKLVLDKILCEEDILDVIWEAGDFHACKCIIVTSTYLSSEIRQIANYKNVVLWEIEDCVRYFGNEQEISVGEISTKPTVKICVRLLKNLLTNFQPMLDIRKYIKDRHSEGWSKEGLIVSVKQIPEFIELLKQMKEQMDMDGRSVSMTNGKNESFGVLGDILDEFDF